jgi:site-specific DNA-methyltransferase (adenine-specific)
MQSTLSSNNRSLLFSDAPEAHIRLLDVPVERCDHSRFNTRKTRSDDRIEVLASRIGRNGFERTRALWAVEVDGRYEVFAGGTRLEAARRAGLATVPVFVHEGLCDEDISRKADEDNENDEYHEPVGLLDVWAECHRLWKEEGWTQQQIAEAKACGEATIRLRCKLHTALPDVAKKATVDGILDEGHLIPVSGVSVDVHGFAAWLTTEQAQAELLKEVLAKHRGSSAGIKPTVKVVRDAAKRWKALIQTADDAYQSLPEDGPWREKFVAQLAANHARTESAINHALNQVVDAKRRSDEVAAARLRGEADAREREAQQLRQKQARLTYLQTQTGKLHHGDARALIDQAPPGFDLLLTDPPYGVEFRSHRRVTSRKKDAIANDGKQEALSLLSDILVKSHPLMAEHATCLIFTSWRNEPEFRRIVESAGFTVRGSLVWVKHNHGSGDLTGAFAPRHERIIHAVKGNPKLIRRCDDVLHGKDRQNSQHPHEKPRDLLRQLIEATTELGNVVVDPFCGTGNVLIEAYSLGRDFLGIEIDDTWHRIAEESIHKLAEDRFELER